MKTGRKKRTAAAKDKNTSIRSFLRADFFLKYITKAKGNLNVNDR